MIATGDNYNLFFFDLVISPVTAELAVLVGKVFG